MKAADDNLSIAFLTGTDKSALLDALLDAGHEVRTVILPHACAREDRLAPVIEVARRQGIPVDRPRRSGLEAAIRQSAPGVLLSAGYPYLLTAEQLKVARFNVNIHPTLLPKYRGPATAWHVIAHGESESGVTAHLIDSGMDSGPILVQRRVALTRFDTVRSLMRKTSALEPEVTLAALALLRKGEVAPPAQDQSEASSYSEYRSPEDSRIDPHRPLIDLYDFIRACDPERFPAFFEIDGERVTVRLSRPHKPSSEQDTI